MPGQLVSSGEGRGGREGARGNNDNFYVAPPTPSFGVAPEVHISRFGWRFGAIWGGRTCNPLMPVQSKQLFSVFGKVVSREAPGRDICDFGADLASKYVRMGRGIPENALRRVP